MKDQFKPLTDALLAHHGKNANGCILTDYTAIPDLKVKASTTSGTSGIGVWRRMRVYWTYDSGMNWDGDAWVKVSEPHFTAEVTR